MHRTTGPVWRCSLICVALAQATEYRWNKQRFEPETSQIIHIDNLLKHQNSEILPIVILISHLLGLQKLCVSCYLRRPKSQTPVLLAFAKPLLALEPWQEGIMSQGSWNVDTKTTVFLDQPWSRTVVTISFLRIVCKSCKCKNICHIMGSKCFKW